MPTKDGVFYELSDSPYRALYGDYTFHFSSRKHQESFLDKLPVRVEWLCDSFSKRFKFEIDARLIAVFQLYFQVETRGCYVKTVDGEVLRCKQNLRLHGLKASVQDSTQPCESTIMRFDAPSEPFQPMPLFSRHK